MFLEEVQIFRYWVPKIEDRLAPEVKEWAEWIRVEDEKLY